MIPPYSRPTPSSTRYPPWYSTTATTTRYPPWYSTTATTTRLKGEFTYILNINIYIMVCIDVSSVDKYTLRAFQVGKTFGLGLKNHSRSIIPSLWDTSQRNVKNWLTLPFSCHFSLWEAAKKVIYFFSGPTSQRP